MRVLRWGETNVCSYRVLRFKLIPSVWYTTSVYRKEMNTNIDCNTPGVAEEANEKFLWREETSGLTGQRRYSQKYKMHMKTLHHEQKSKNIIKGRFRPP